jgi:biotin carboxyl carrier protein
MKKQAQPSRTPGSGHNKPARSVPAGDLSLTELEIGDTRYVTHLTEKFRNRKRWEKPDPGKLVASIPGTVQKIMVSEGMEVDQGTPLIILEAMKMRNELVSPMRGIIRKIHVSEGEKIPKGQLLLEFKKR